MVICFFFKQKTAYDMRISDWSSDVCSSDLRLAISSGWRPLYGSTAAIRYVAPIVCARISAINSRRRAVPAQRQRIRSDERSEGKGRVRTCRFRQTPYHEKKNHIPNQQSIITAPYNSPQPFSYSQTTI